MSNETKNASKTWWLYELLGVLSIVMSVMIFIRPFEAYAGLVVYFSLLFIISGILRTIFSVSNRSNLGAWGWYLAGGILDMMIGFLLITRLDIAAVALPFYVGFFLLFGSISAIGKSFDMKSFGREDWSWLLFAGLAGLFFSVMILLNPVLGMSSLVTWTWMAFVAIGIFYFYLGFTFRRINTFRV